LKFAILAKNPKVSRLQEILDKFIDKKTDTFYYDDIKTAKHELLMLDLCKKYGVRTFGVPRACIVADVIFTIYPDKTEKTRNIS
jgi:hypothetical protein